MSLRRSLLLLSVCLSQLTFATDYYLDATAGADTNPGTSSSQAWQTLAKVNGTTLRPGDSVLLKRGQTFTGSLTINQSGDAGAPITIGAWGTGAKPVLSGFATLSGWATVDAGISAVQLSSLPDDLNLVTLNGTPQAVGRTPNADAPYQGFWQYESFASNGSSITDNELAAAPDWSGAEAVIMNYHWWSERMRITSHVGHTLNITTTWAPTAPYAAQLTPYTEFSAGFGYFIQRDPRTLDRPGEWYLDTAAHRLLIFFGATAPASLTIRASTVETLLNLGNRSNIVVSDLQFEGANQFGIWAKDGDGITVQRCDFDDMGFRSIGLYNVGRVLIDGITSDDSLSGAVEVASANKQTAVLRNSTLSNTGVLPGMGVFSSSGDFKAATVSVSRDGLIENNVVRRSGYCGIQFQGSDFIVQRNVIDEYDFVKDDGGGIYTWVAGTEAAPQKTFFNRIIRNNIVSNAIGTLGGAKSGNFDTAGIYLDGRTMNVEVTDNTVFNITGPALYANNPTGVHFTRNLTFNSDRGLGLTRYEWGAIYDAGVTGNVFVAADATQAFFEYADLDLSVPRQVSLRDALQYAAPFDNNLYSRNAPLGFVISYNVDAGLPRSYPPAESLEGWRDLSGNDLDSGYLPQGLPAYSVTDAGANAVSNGTFTTSLSGFTIFPTTSPRHVGSWVDAGMLQLVPQGVGSTTSASLVYTNVGAINAAQSYRVRFKTLGSTNDGQLRVYLRQTASPYTQLTPAQYASYGTTLKQHEFVFANPPTETATLVIAVSQTASTLWLDDVEFAPVAATFIDPASLLRFEYNDTAQAKQVTLSGTYRDAWGVTQSGSLTLQPFSSTVLVLTSLSANRPPMADAGVDQQLVEPTSTTTLIGSGSDSDGTIASYAWSKVSGSGLLRQTSGPQVQVTGLQVGASVFRLTVTDNQGAQGSDDVTVVVQPASGSDAGTPIDGGSGDAGPVPDAGSADAGLDDAGTLVDGGLSDDAGLADAGTTTTADAGTSSVSDAGTDEPPPVPPCGCQGAPGSSLLLLSLTALWARRRR